ncbi:DUF305 domain-containing protein [Microbacterium sp. NPDC086615]|uniref:DUF305 domain-containing protein n=1 Tax=Microbacterium sp. NPDC086615 TaxID=3154865 RepID=UPI003449AC0E
MTDDAPGARPAVRWIVVAVVTVAIVAVAFAIGRFTAFGATAAPTYPSTTSADAGFARDMQVHHTQAVLMAMEIYRKTDDDELRTLSYDIATAQSGQRGEMYGWLVQWGLPQSSPQPLMTWMQSSGAHSHGDTSAYTQDELLAQMGMATDAELDQLQTLEGQPADCLFLSLMIRHHQGAIPMAEAVIELGDQPRVAEVAQAIITGQSAEIDAMRDIQSRLACTA